MALAFVRAVAGFLWKRLKYVTVSWSTWWYVYIPGELVNVTMGIASWYFFAYFLSSGGVENVIGYVILGLAANTLLRSALVHVYWAVYGLYSGYMESAGFRMRQWEYYSLAGIPRYVAIAGFALFDTLRSAVLFAIYLLAGAAFFGFRLGPSADPLAAALALALGYLGTLTLGVLLASTFWLFIRYRELSLNPFVWLVETLVPVVSGIYYPRSVLPPPLYAAGALLPQTYAVEGLRRALGIEPGPATADLAVLAGFAALLPAALWVFRRSEDWALRRSGVL